MGLDVSLILIIVAALLAGVNIALVLIISRHSKMLEVSQANPPAVAAPALEITPEYLAELEAKTKATFTRVVDENAASLNQVMAAAVAKINAQVDELTKSALSQEIAEYQTTLSTAKEKIIQDLARLSDEAHARQKALDDKLEAQLQKRRTEVAAKLDKDLSQIVVSYIVECFGPGVDFNSQKDYIFKSLSNHKEELKGDILG